MSILDELAEYAKYRVSLYKREVPLPEMKRLALSKRGNFAFEKKLSEKGVSFICECKRASPSKGIIAEDFPYLDIADDYERAGADCISVLTEPKWFLGKDSYLEEIAERVKIPCLRKDFTVDEYMIYQAAVCGASAVLLIVSLLGRDRLCEYLDICDGLGISALTEVHDERETETALKCGSRIIGVNNRNLKDFSVDMGNAARLRSLVPEGVLFASESGIKSAEDVEKVRRMGGDAVLIGETLMLAKDRAAKLKELRGYDKG